MRLQAFLRSLDRSLIFMDTASRKYHVYNRPEMQNADLSILKYMIRFILQNYAAKISLVDIAASGAVGQSKPAPHSEHTKEKNSQLE